jgi:aminopeptidase N
VPLSPALLGVIGRHADAAQFEQLRRMAGSERDAQRRSLLWSSLAGNRELALARQAMALARSDEVPVADAPWLLVSAAYAGHIAAAWTELRTHQAELMGDLAEWDRAELAPALLASAGDVRLAGALLAWTPALLGQRAMPAARKAAGVIRVNAALAQRVVPDLARWLGH